MKILYLSTWFPYPPDNGARIRAYNLMKALSKRHEVFLISLLQDDSRREDAEHLKDVCEVISLHESHWFKPGSIKSTIGFFSSRPRSAVDTYNPAVKAAVLNALEEIKPDSLVASTLGVAEYVPDYLDIPTLLDHHNCDYAVLKRRAEAEENPFRKLRLDLGWMKFARWEAGMCRKFSSVIMVTEKDKVLLNQFAPDLTNITVIANGVDTEAYSPASWKPEHSTLIYNGALTYGANLDAVRYYTAEIFPRLDYECPEVTLRVTGRNAGVDLAGISDSPGVELTGYVEKMQSLLSKSAACVVPLRQGGGSRLKILEAMAAGVPVISTSIGAEGLDVTDGKHLIVANTPSYFAAAIARVLTDPDLAQALSRNARKLVEQKYSWPVLGEEFVKVVEEADSQIA